MFSQKLDLTDQSTIKIYHDAFLQHGGAEKVAISWAKYLDCPIIAIAKGRKFSWTSDTMIFEKAPFIQSHKMLQFLFPLIPLILKLLKFNNDDLRLVSTTGLAHYFGGSWKKRVIYMHSPSRWIWNEDEIERDLSSIVKFTMSMFRPFFRKYDLSKIKDDDILIANSRATKLRIQEIYNKEALVVFPPITASSLVSIPPAKVGVESIFFLAIGRLKAYKGFNEAIEACKLANVKLVLVGEGSSKFQSENVIGLGFVTEEELTWLYQNAQALIATGAEDFGLTPVEAALHGCPTLAYPRRGYLDSVRHRFTGEILTECSVNTMSVAIKNFAKTDYSQTNLKIFAEEFSIDTHMKKLVAAFSDDKFR
jgi:glycosyltransferase involved in cell wall biosynthesis